MDGQEKDVDTVAKSVLLTGYGGFHNIKVQNLPSPGNPQHNQVAVRVQACGLNFADIYTRQGLVRDQALPFVMGLECAGIVTATGRDVTNFKTGDHVLVHTGSHGLQSDKVCVEADCCHLMPESMSWEEAAAFPINYLTAYFCLFEIGNLRESQTVLIPSAGGGVGWAATQLAKTVANVRVIGLASPSKHEAIRLNGVDIAIDSLDPHWDQTVRSVCPGGVDIALDFSSGDNFQRTRQLVKDLGKTILIGANGMIDGETLSLWRVLRNWWSTSNVKPIDLIVNSCAVAGFHLTRVKQNQPQRYRDVYARLIDLYNRKLIRPRIDSVWTFDQIAQATNRLARRENIGKVVLKP